METQEVLDEIKRVEDFTCSYWWPLYERWENDKEQRASAPTQGPIMLDIIKKRGEYVHYLKEQLPSPSKEE